VGHGTVAALRTLVVAAFLEMFTKPFTTRAPALLEWCRLRTGIGRFPPAYTNGYGPTLRPVNVAQNNKPLTMLSSIVRSIDVPMECTVWRFWNTVYTRSDGFEYCLYIFYF